MQASYRSFTSVPPSILCLAIAGTRTFRTSAFVSVDSRAWGLLHYSIAIIAMALVGSQGILLFAAPMVLGGLTIPCDGISCAGRSTDSAPTSTHESMRFYVIG